MFILLKKIVTFIFTLKSESDKVWDFYTENFYFKSFLLFQFHSNLKIENQQKIWNMDVLIHADMNSFRSWMFTC